MIAAIRAVAFAAGLALLAATAHVTVSHAGGYAAPGAVLTLAIALGVGVAALSVGQAWSAGRRGVAAWLMLAIVAGEAFGFLLTAERLVVSREAAQAPLRDAEDAHAKAAQRVSDATAALARAPASSSRLDAALAAKTAADAAVLVKSAERGCAANCRSLLQAQVDTANADVAAARAAIGDGAATAQRELEAARAALGAKPAPASATPLADRTGVPAWVIDLITAALGSLAANGLGCGLIAFSAHGRREDPLVEVATPPHSESLAAIPAAAGRNHVARFVRLTVAPSADGEVSLRELHKRYVAFCQTENLMPMRTADFGRELRDVVDALGLACVSTGDDILVRGAALVPRSRPPTRATQRALGHMVSVGRA